MNTSHNQKSPEPLKFNKNTPEFKPKNLKTPEFKPETPEFKPKIQKPKKYNENPEWADDLDTDFDQNMVLEGLPDDFRMDPAIQNSTRKLQQQNDTNNHGKIVQSSWLDAKLKLPQSESKNLGELFKKHLENKHPENNNKIEKIWGQNVPKSNAGWGDDSEIKKHRTD